MLAKNILLPNLSFKKIVFIFFTTFSLSIIVLLFFASKEKKYNVVEKKDLSLTYDCQKLNCLQAYYQFPKNHPEYKKTITEEELPAKIDKVLQEKETIQFSPTNAELKKAILANLNINFLLENINERGLVVTNISNKNHQNYLEKEVLFTDEHVGTFDVLILIPKKKGIKNKFPAIIGLHGHGDSNKTFMNKYLGADLAQSGFVVIMPSFRAMSSQPDEEISLLLLQNGYTLMGLRVYETLLLIKYLQYLEIVDNNNIGILSHSGGSSCANLVVRITPSIKAQATDYFVNWLPYKAKIHCEVIPALSYYQKAINSYQSLSIPVLSLPYSFANRQQTIISFFETHLKKNNL